MYEIVKRFSKEALLEALEREYVPIRTEDGCCPLGVVLRSEGRSERRLPTPTDVANALVEQRNIMVWSQIIHEAEKFIYDWDDGKIPNLREALGLDNESEGGECL